MTDPVRLQLSRRKGFNLQAHSRETNGLEAVKVDRTTKCGNPFIVGPECRALSAQESVSLFRCAVISGGYWAAGDRFCGAPMVTTSQLRQELRGKNLACWCKLGAPCHGDVLLELANA